MGLTLLELYFLTAFLWRLKSKIKVPSGSVSAEIRLPDLQAAASSLLLTWQRKLALWSSFLGAKLLSHVHIFVTPWTVARQAPLSMRFSRPGYWSGLSCPPSGDLPDPGIELAPLIFSALAGGFFTTSTTWEAALISS